ncbi:hypothetical protein LTS18_000355, partial [Coniosporium uncinatum]
CGRRFPATEAGKQTKARHMDWHFKINTRVAEQSRSVINRSWYIDEMEWIKHRDVDPASAESASSNGTDGKAKEKKKEAKDMFVPVPEDVGLQNQICPICQEKFETVWERETQQPVWMNAVKVGGRTYHATCYAEVKGGLGSMTGGGPMRTRASATPEPSVLGKRKHVEEA